ncbi:MAG: hypothetical protein LBB21_02500 [Holosporaceae bacterium]|jgi:hypothetical protein|nr:hypothetical protein [Holosporaceae bacterium]
MSSKIVTLMQRGGGQVLGKPYIGAIFVELAITIPAFAATLYYLHDIPKYKRTYSKMKFCANCMISILQNISQERSDKRVTFTDIKNSVAASYLTIYPANSEFNTERNTAIFGHVPMGFIYLVKGNSNGTASILWGNRFHMAYTSYSPKEITIDTDFYTTLIGRYSNVAPSLICPDLKIGNGENKIIIECGYHYYNYTTAYKFTGGQNAKNVPSKSAFGFLTLYPKANNLYSYFNTIVIFTPKPGVLDGVPQQ